MMSETQKIEKIIKAAVLPFSIMPDKSISLLLGKIRLQKWVRSSHLHSDFGGKTDSNDLDMYYTAAREFMEETLGQVNIVQRGTQSIESVYKKLKNKEYFACVKTHHYSKKTHEKLTVATFLVCIPFQPNINLKYTTYKQALKKCTSLDNTNHSLYKWALKQPALQLQTNHTLKLKQCYNEISDLRYFGLEYVDYVSTNKVMHNRQLTLLHNCRKRLLKILPVLKSYQDILKKQKQK